MIRQKYDKLKFLIDSVPPGFLVDSSWFERHNLSRRLSYHYVKRGWLERIYHGVFRRLAPGINTTSELDWKVCLFSAQHIMDYKLHVGSTTALALQGQLHYVPMHKDHSVWVYGNDAPSWLFKLPLNARLRTRSLSLFSQPHDGLINEPSEFGAFQSKFLSWDRELTMATPERAILEALDGLPDNQSFDNLDKVFEALVNIRPHLMSNMLKQCRKIKVTKLFFVFADRHNHAWRKYLDPKEFNLGKGNRALIKNGKLHKRYQIMVPSEFADQLEEELHAY